MAEKSTSGGEDAPAARDEAGGYPYPGAGPGSVPPLPPLTPDPSFAPGFQGQWQQPELKQARSGGDRTVNITLYMASLLFVVAGGFFVTSPTGELVRFLVGALLAAAFYTVGLVLNARVVRLRPASIALVGTGLALVPVVGIAMDSLLIHNARLSWLITSIVGLGAFAVSALRLNSQLLGYLCIAFIASTAVSATEVFGTALLWTFVLLVVISSALSLLARRIPEGRFTQLLTPLRTLEVWFVPVIAVVSLFMMSPLQAWERAVVMGSYTLYWLVRTLVDSGRQRVLQHYAWRVGALGFTWFVIDAIPGTSNWIIVVPALTLSLQIVLNHLLPALGDAIRPWLVVDSRISLGLAGLLAAGIAVDLGARTPAPGAQLFTHAGAENLGTILTAIALVAGLSVSALVHCLRVPRDRAWMPLLALPAALILTGGVDAKPLILLLLMVSVFWLTQSLHHEADAALLRSAALLVIVWVAPILVLDVFPLSPGRGLLASATLSLGVLGVLFFQLRSRPVLEGSRFWPVFWAALTLYYAIAIWWTGVAADRYAEPLTVPLVLILQALGLVIATLAYLAWRREHVRASVLALAAGGIWTLQAGAVMNAVPGENWQGTTALLAALAATALGARSRAQSRYLFWLVARILMVLGLAQVFSAADSRWGPWELGGQRLSVWFIVVVLLLITTAVPALALRAERASAASDAPNIEVLLSTLMAGTAFVLLAGPQGWRPGSSEQAQILVGWQEVLAILILGLLAAVPVLFRSRHELSFATLGGGAFLLSCGVAQFPARGAAFGFLLMSVVLMLVTLLGAWRPAFRSWRPWYQVSARLASLILVWSFVSFIQAPESVVLLTLVAFCLIQHGVTAYTSRHDAPKVSTVARWSVLAVHGTVVAGYAAAYAHEGDYWWALLAAVSLLAAAVIIMVRTGSFWYLLWVTFTVLVMLPPTFATTSPLFADLDPRQSAAALTLAAACAALASTLYRLFPRSSSIRQRRILWFASVAVFTVQAMNAAIDTERGWPVLAIVTLVGLVLSATAVLERIPLMFPLAGALVIFGGFGTAGLLESGPSEPDSLAWSWTLAGLVLGLLFALPGLLLQAEGLQRKQRRASWVLSIIAFGLGALASLLHMHTAWMTPLLLLALVAAGVRAAHGRKRLVFVDVGGLLVALALYRAASWELIDASLFWGLQVFVLYGFLLGFAHHFWAVSRIRSGMAPARQQSLQRLGLAFFFVAAGFLSLSFLSASRPGVPEQVWLVAGFALLVVAGLLTSRQVFSWWGAAGITVAVVLTLRANVYVWLSLIGLFLILVVVLTLLRRKPSADEPASRQAGTPVFGNPAGAGKQWAPTPLVFSPAAPNPAPPASPAAGGPSPAAPNPAPPASPAAGGPVPAAPNPAAPLAPSPAAPTAGGAAPERGNVVPPLPERQPRIRPDGAADQGTS